MNDPILAERLLQRRRVMGDSPPCSPEREWDAYP